MPRKCEVDPYPNQPWGSTPIERMEKANLDEHAEEVMLSRFVSMVI